MTEDEIKIATNKCFHGNWMCNEKVGSETVQIRIAITQEKTTIIRLVDDVEKENITISSNAHWYDNYLSFTETQRFYIRYANATQMVFGEVETPGDINGRNKWQFKFTRLEN